MSDWECSVCGYLHKEEIAPEKCPVCEAPQQMFKQQAGEDNIDVETVNSEVKEVSQVAAQADDSTVVKRWRCSVSGYMHTGQQPPEKCPICEATAEQFEEVEDEIEEDLAESSKRWRCTVCGYIHEGPEPPEKCPVCAAPASMFVEIDMGGKALGEPDQQPIEPLDISPGPKAEDQPQAQGFVNTIGNLVLSLHLHPITTHFPNGILPAAVLFLALGIYFNTAFLEVAAYVNFIFVLVLLPVVLFTGYIEWQKRYNGFKSAIFITKIICALIVLAAVNVLVFWRLLDPQVAAAGSPSQLVYLGVAGLALGATGIAGHLGGKLVFGSRG